MPDTSVHVPRCASDTVRGILGEGGQHFLSRYTLCGSVTVLQVGIERWVGCGQIQVGRPWVEKTWHQGLAFE